ncbi:RNA polymerase sigma factor [Streptomyces profundus]|uniref:RNA polymerase sigma factor n=1 Tax=Streptomyces profundus TaxID=2867410 RepID=UPI001D16D0AA|nr:RNA polymerase sigma factor [Streptomyces sp. MA3_2.13]UED84377.1 RNA polymerase sigma factor [Streptomyces sp. MA3_2.13]
MHARVRAGDPEAFRELFRAHARLIHRYALRATGDTTLAEDVVSLTFLEAWRLRDRFRDEGHGPRPWLMGIALNTLRNTARSRRRYQHVLTRLPSDEAMPDIADEVVGRITDASRVAAARRALDRLRPKDREVFMLCVWSGLSHAEAAVALGVREGAVRTRLFRARERLRALTDEELTTGAPRETAVKRRPGSGQGTVDRRLTAVRSEEGTSREA